ncbi:MAG: hypothetical protein PHU23_13360, partial [Dehalococcoidales bacterium]|nr:hypothetical protein [Dehalococcoidales bacterium]
AWVALDRAIRIAGSYDLSGAAVAKWKKVRKTIREQVLAQGYNEDAGAFTLHYGSKELDAANLRIPLLEFLPVDDIRVQNTIDRTMDLLVNNGLVHRYLTDDGLPGKEGAFGLCTFWLVDVLAFSGRMREAHDIFSRVLGCANHIGLLAEQFDPQTSEHLGNFPQAFTHIGLVNSVLYLAHAEGKAIPDNYAMGGLSQRTYARK